MENKNIKKTKRFYKIDEMVWIVGEKKEGKVVSINKEEHEVTVTIKEGAVIEKLTVKMWEIDKLKYSAREKLLKTKQNKNESDKLSTIHSLLKKMFYPEVYFARIRESAVIPSKRIEDAGYDIYANLEPNENGRIEIECPVLNTTLVPTGLAVAMPNTHYFNLKHERGSTGVQSMSVLAGVVDSGFRNEMFIALTPLKKTVFITNAVEKVVESDLYILYPYTKAIAQGTIDLVPVAKLTELTYDELKKIESERGMSMLGQSGK